MLTFAFCTYNRADRLEKLVTAMRTQLCPIPFEILAVNNNSSDNTLDILEHLSQQPGVKLRFVTESEQGIVPARNRAITESFDSDILVFIDDDEIPQPGLLCAAYDAIVNEGAQCVGGHIDVDFMPYDRPSWLDTEIEGFLGRLNHGTTAFWILDDSTPIWSGNVAYDMRLFREHPSLKFDIRYDRKGIGVGGGEDAIMFRTLLTLNARIRYRPDMAIWHMVEPWKLKRRYFIKLHYRAGIHSGKYELLDYSHRIFGMPPFLLAQFFRQSVKALIMQISMRSGALRQCMNAAYSLGALLGYRGRDRE